MLFYIIRNNQIETTFSVKKLGFSEAHFRNQYPLHFNGIIPIVRTCFSLGDWGILSGLPRALKTLHPQAKIAIPSPQWAEKVFSNFYESSPIWNNCWENINVIFSNNPFVDVIFNDQNSFNYTELPHDHYRVFKDDTDIEEPLANQMFRFFGGDPTKFDLRPELYFTPEEVTIGDTILKKLNINIFGTLLLASTFKFSTNSTGQWPEKYELPLMEIVERYLDAYPDMKFLYYSDFNISETKWNIFNKSRGVRLIDIKKLDIPIRIQLYLKTQAIVNIGYQSGMNDSVGSRYADMFTVSPYSEKELGSNRVDKVNYIFV